MPLWVFSFFTHGSRNIKVNKYALAFLVKVFTKSKWLSYFVINFYKSMHLVCLEKVIMWFLDESKIIVRMALSENFFGKNFFRNKV